MEAGRGVSGLSFAGAGKKTGVGAASRAAGPGLAMRRHAMMLGLLIASVAASERAQADCNPQIARDNVTATCTGTTTGTPVGYGTGNEINLNTTVVQGATVTGTAGVNDDAGVGIAFNTGSVTNFGAISGTGGATPNSTGVGI